MIDKELFIPLDLAKSANSKGFWEECFAQYANTELLYPKMYDDVTKNVTKAPTYDQIIKWFRERHHIHIEITPITKKAWSYNIYDIAKDGEGFIDNEPQESKDYYKILNKALEEALNLIK